MFGNLVINKIYRMYAAAFFEQKKQKEVMFMGFFNIPFSMKFMVKETAIWLSFRLKLLNTKYGKLVFCSHEGNLQNSPYSSAKAGFEITKSCSFYNYWVPLYCSSIFFNACMPPSFLGFSSSDRLYILIASSRLPDSASASP